MIHLDFDFISSNKLLLTQVMRNPKIILHRFKIIFQVGCFFTAIYFTTLFSTQYQENIDAQLIAIKKFKEENDNVYPTFSMCFKGTKFHWYHDLEIFNSYGLNATQYELMLKGEIARRYDRNYPVRSYEKTPIFLNNGSDVDFSKYHLQTKDVMTVFIHSIKFSSEDSSMDTHVTITNNGNESKEHPLYLSFQTADTICFSRNTDQNSKSIRLNDLITLNSSALSESVKYEDTLLEDTQLDIFVHYPNQLMQSFGKAKYSTSFSQLLSTLNDTDPKILEFKLSECKRIKRRVDSNVPCSVNIKNYDQFFQQKVADYLGCVPIYFKQAVAKQANIEECNSKSKLMEAQYIIKNFERFLNGIEKPCDEMLVLTIESVNNNPNPKPNDIAIEFIYSENVYEEIEYIKAIKFDSWLSNVGGFVGIFLGYSMMQFPEVLLFFATMFNKEKRNYVRGKVSSLLVHFLE